MRTGTGNQLSNLAATQGTDDYMELKLNSRRGKPVGVQEWLTSLNEAHAISQKFSDIKEKANEVGSNWSEESASTKAVDGVYRVTDVTEIDSVPPGSTVIYVDEFGNESEPMQTPNAASPMSGR